MQDDNIASNQQKAAHGTGAIEQIQAVEASEALRLQTEIDAMHQEFEQAKEATVKRKEDATATTKKKANDELEALKNTELQPMLEKANELKAKAVANIESHAKKNKQPALDTIITKFLEL